MQGIDEFNKKPKKGIEFLQEAGLLSVPLVPAELVYYMKENPKFDKKVIGDYIGDRKNAKVLEAFVRYGKTWYFDLKSLNPTSSPDFHEVFPLLKEAGAFLLSFYRTGTHFAPMHYFYLSWKRQKTFGPEKIFSDGFLTFSEGIEIKFLRVMG